jgi:uncharacterized membrane protein YidH (DUF202 family)
MAIERTLLAYIRTALALLISGATGFYISQFLWVRISAGVLVALGIATVALGTVRYRRRKRTLQQFRSLATEIDD